MKKQSEMEGTIGRGIRAASLSANPEEPGATGGTTAVLDGG
jgi:hypothetical protein